MLRNNTICRLLLVKSVRIEELIHSMTKTVSFSKLVFVFEHCYDFTHTYVSQSKFDKAWNLALCNIIVDRICANDFRRNALNDRRFK